MATPRHCGDDRYGRDREWHCDHESILQNGSDDQEETEPSKDETESSLLSTKITQLINSKLREYYVYWIFMVSAFYWL